MNNNNTLPKNHEVAVEVACDLLSNDNHNHHIEEGVVLHLNLVTPFKTVAHWYGFNGEGAPLSHALESELITNTFGITVPAEPNLYIVDKAANVLSYWWRRRRLRNRLFLRPMRKRELPHPDLRLIKSLEILI